MIIGITSLARAGKDTLADYLVKKYGFIKLNMSDVLRDELLNQGKQATKENMSLLGDEWRKKFGKDIVIKKTLEKARTYKENVVITGFRSPEEVLYMRESTEFCLISLEAVASIRFSRRSQADPQTEEEFLARDERDIKNKGLEATIAIAGYKIKNGGSLEEFHQKIDQLMQKILKK